LVGLAVVRLAVVRLTVVGLVCPVVPIDMREEQPADKVSTPRIMEVARSRRIP
jgi:hypothetical protein